MLFNSLRESWRTSPESWHLSQIYNTITVISHTITHGEHLLRVGPEYITSVQYTYIVRSKRHSRPGYVSPGEITRNHPSSHNGALARGMARPGKAPTSAHRRSSVPSGTQGFGNLPKDRHGLGETTYTTSESSLCTNGVLIPNTQVGV